MISRRKHSDRIALWNKNKHDEVCQWSFWLRAVRVEADLQIFSSGSNHEHGSKNANRSTAGRWYADGVSGKRV